MTTQKYIQIWRIFGVHPNGNVDVVDDDGDVLQNIPPELADQVITARDRFVDIASPARQARRAEVGKRIIPSLTSPLGAWCSYAAAAEREIQRLEAQTPEACQMLEEENARLRSAIEKARDALLNIGDGEALDILDKAFQGEVEP